MLTGEELGHAIKEAIELKRVSKAAVARRFGVKPPSVQDWVKTGRISKPNLMELIDWCSDVVGPDHWGLQGSLPQPATSSKSADPDDVIEKVTQLMARLPKGAQHRIYAMALDEADKATGKDAKSEHKTERKTQGGR